MTEMLIVRHHLNFCIVTSRQVYLDLVRTSLIELFLANVSRTQFSLKKHSSV